VLENCPASVSTYVARALAQVNVDVQTAKVVLKEISRLQLTSGKTILADFYIPTCGLVPNYSYFLKELLTASGHVVVDEHLKAATGVYAIGDVCATENSQFITCDRQSAYLAQSVVALLNGKPTKPYSVASNRELLSLDRISANLAGFLGLQIGKEAGTGHFGCFRIPSFVIVMARKNLFLQNLKPTVDGSFY
jgi:apoptosis-inducing factor 2